MNNGNMYANIVNTLLHSQGDDHKMLIDKHYAYEDCELCSSFIWHGLKPSILMENNEENG